MSIDEESFPYDSLFDAMDNELNTEFHMVSAEGFKTFGCSSTFISDPKITNTIAINVLENDEINDKTNASVLRERFRNNTTYTKSVLPTKPTTSMDSTGILSRASSLDCVLHQKERERICSYQDIHPLHIRRRYQHVESKVGKIIAEHSAMTQKRAKSQHLCDDVIKEPHTSGLLFDEQLMQEHDRLKSLCNYLNERLQEKNVNTVRLRQNLDHLRIELMQAQDKIHVLEIALRKNQHTHMYHTSEFLKKADTSERNTIATQTGIPTPPTPQPMPPAFLLLTESPTTKMQLVRQTNYKKVVQSAAHKAYNNNSKSTGPASSDRDTATSHSTSSKSNSTSLNSMSNSTSVYAGGYRSDTYCITSNDEPNPSYDSRSRRSSFRCSSDSAIEMPYEEQNHEHENEQQEHRQKQKLQKERLQLFQRRSRHAYNNINFNSFDTESSFHNNNNNNIIIFKSDNLRDLNGVPGSFRSLNVSADHHIDNENNMAMDSQTTYKPGNVDVPSAYVCGKSKSRKNCLPSGCLRFFSPCTHCFKRISVSQDTSLFEMNLLGNQSTFNEPKPR